jgi:endonuclease/exonuclease/phosphatase (EEP) superfamily protein YafD
MLCLACILSLAGFARVDTLLFELISHTRLHLFGVLVLGCLWLGLRRKWKALLPVAICFGISGASVLPWFFGHGSVLEAGGPGGIRILMANVLTTNGNHAAVLDLIRAEDPDIIVLEETSLAWLAGLQELVEDYPFHVEEARSDHFGIVVLSRLEPVDLRFVDFAGRGYPSVVGEFDLQGSPLTLIATHPMAPVGSTLREIRNAQLVDLAKFARTVPNAVVIGDMNTTMWSLQHTLFERDSGLQNARRDFGILPTWPTFFGPLGIPLDHCFVSPSIQVRDLRVGPDVGSDHLPIIVDCLLVRKTPGGPKTSAGQGLPHPASRK